MCDTIKIKGEEGESMKPIKLKELIATAKDPFKGDGSYLHDLLT